MRTKDVVELTGVSKDTLRYYEEYGILRPNRESYAREYTEANIERLEQIKQLKQLGFSLKEIKELVLFVERYSTLEAIESMPFEDQQVIERLLVRKIEAIEIKRRVLDEGLVKLSQMRDKIQNLKQ